MATLTEPTYTQLSGPSFTAGTLSDISSCTTYVEGKLQRGSLTTSTTPSTTEVQQELIRAKEELCEVHGFTWQRRYAYCSTTTDAYRYALPADFGGGDVRVRDITNDFMLRRFEKDYYDLKYPDTSEESSDEPLGYCIKDRELWLTCPAGGTYTLELEYERTGEDSTATDVSYLPERFRFLICDFALSQAFRLLQQWDAAQLYQNDWERGLVKARRGSAKQKWQDYNQALMWQQEYATRYNQQ